MIYSQTPLHNGPVRVSIKADGDGATLTFLDTQWSTVLSVPPSYLHSLHLFFFFFFSPLISQLLSLTHSHWDAHMRVLTGPSLLLLLLPFTFFNITHSSKIPSRYFVSSSNFGSRNSRTDAQRHKSARRSFACGSSRLLRLLRLSVRLSAY